MKLSVTKCPHCSGIIRSDIDYCHYCGNLVLSLPAHTTSGARPDQVAHVRRVDESRIVLLHLSGIISLLTILAFVALAGYFILVAPTGATEPPFLPFLVSYIVLYVANMVGSGMWFRLKGKRGGFRKGCILAWLLQVVIAAYVFYYYCRDILRSKDYS